MSRRKRSALAQVEDYAETCAEYGQYALAASAIAKRFTSVVDELLYGPRAKRTTPQETRRMHQKDQGEHIGDGVYYYPPEWERSK